jgi:spermidine/putrescine transport system substrate-binding protein
MQRRQFLQAAAFGAIGLSLGACDAGWSTADAVDRSRLTQTIKIFHWSDYASSEVLRRFEEEFGVGVLIDTASTNAQIRDAIAAGANHGYDLIVIADYTVASMSREGLLERIEYGPKGKLGNLLKTSLALYYDPANLYSVPYLWGTTGVLYNPARVVNPISAWPQLLTPPDALIGRIGMLNDAREVLAVALRTGGASGNSRDPAAIAAARQRLQRQRRFVANYDSPEINSQRVLADELIVAMTRTHNAMAARLQNPSLAYALPDAVTTIWQDNFAIPRGAPSRYTAEVFIDFMLRPEIAAVNARSVGAATPNDAALRLNLIDAAILSDPAIYPNLNEAKDKFEWLEPLPEATELEYEQILTELKGG